MRTKPHIISTLTVFLLNLTPTAAYPAQRFAQTESLPPPEIQSSPLPAPEPAPILPAQQETVRRLIEKEIAGSQQLTDRVDSKVKDHFELTMGLLNLLITMLIAIPIGTGFVFWWLRQSVIDRLVSDIRRQFQQETETLVKQQLEEAVTARLQSQIATFEAELEQLRTDFGQRLHHLYQDVEKEKDLAVQELGQILADVGQNDTVPAPVGYRLQELTGRLKSIRTDSPDLTFSASDYLKTAEASYLAQQYDEAVASYRSALALEPDSAQGWRGLAKTLRQMGHPSEALTANEELIHRYPQDPWGWFGKGYALADMRQYEAALLAYDAAIQFEPNRSTFWKRKGYALTRLRRYNEALDCFDKALRVNPDSADTYYAKADCYAAQQQTEMAIDHLKEAIRRRPDYQIRVKTDPDFEALRRSELFRQVFSASVH
jgi:tetratricopeptide (TPR) repeat protein